MSDEEDPATLKRRVQYQRHRERERAYQRDYYARNGDRIRAQVRARQAVRSDEVRAYAKVWRQQHRRRDPAYYLLQSARKRAKKKGMEFAITAADIPIPAVCPILGIPLHTGGGLVSPNSPSIDRVNNAEGYIQGNVRVISYRANVIKSDMSYEEATALALNWWNR